MGDQSRFSSNIRKLVSMKDLSLCGYNYHDCHVLLMVFLPIAIREIKPVGAGPGFVIWLFNISQGCKKNWLPSCTASFLQPQTARILSQVDVARRTARVCCCRPEMRRMRPHGREKWNRDGQGGDLVSAGWESWLAVSRGVGHLSPYKIEMSIL